MKKVLAVFFSAVTIAAFSSGISPAQAKMGCPYGGSPNWQGLCDVTTEDGESYFGPPIEVPDDPPIPPRQLPTPVASQPSTATPGGTQIENSNPTNIVANPVVAVNPVIWGNGNSVSSTVNNVNTTNNTNSNTVVNNTTHNVSNLMQNTSNVSNILEVNGGYLVIGENGLAEFFSTGKSNEDSTEELEEVETVEDAVYLSRDELPKSILRAVNRIPNRILMDNSLRLSSILKNAESVTEDICTINKRRITFSSSGVCAIEIPIGENIYEHEIRVTK